MNFLKEKIKSVPYIFLWVEKNATVSFLWNGFVSFSFMVMHDI